MQNQKNVAPKSGEIVESEDPDVKSATKSPPDTTTETANAAPPDIKNDTGHH